MFFIRGLFKNRSSQGRVWLGQTVIFRGIHCNNVDGEVVPKRGNVDKHYVIQVVSGEEFKTLQLVKTIVASELLEDAYIPVVEQYRKYHGEWRVVKEILFPGYLFVVSDRIAELYFALKRVPRFTRLLGADKEFLWPLSEEEVAFLQSFCANKSHTVDLSLGYIVGDKVTITSGPLVGKEASIIKIDRHKRIACLEIRFFNQTLISKVGLEIIRKE